MQEIIDRLNESDRLPYLAARHHIDSTTFVYQTGEIGREYYWWIHYPQVSFASMSDIKKAYGVE